MGNLSSVKHGLRILRLVSEARESVGASDLSRELGMHRSSVYRLCQALADDGFLEQDGQTRKYRIGPVAFEVGQAYLGDGDLPRTAAQIFGRLAPEYTWYLGTLWGPEVRLLVVIEGSGPVKVTARPGERRWAHATALGKVLLASLPEPELDRLMETYPFPAITKDTLVAPQDLSKVLATVRARGWAESRNESLEGVSSFGAPVVNGQGKMVAGTSVSLLTHIVDGWTDSEKERLVAKVRTAAAELGKLFAHTRG